MVKKKEKVESLGTSGKVTFEKDEGSRSQKNMVVLKELTKRYKQLLALDNVSIEIKEGEIFGYIGPNGAGKTTTIKIMVDLICRENIFGCLQKGRC